MLILAKFISMKINFLVDGTAVVAEWLRRWTRNPLGSARTGSNPVGSEHFECHRLTI